MAIKVSNTVVIDDNKNLANVNSASFTGNTSIKVPVGSSAQRPSGTPGDFRYNTDSNSFEGYTNAWGAIGGSTGQVSYNVITKSVNFNALAGNLYTLTANITATLPASPNVSDTIILFNSSGYANGVINRNGNHIMSASQDMIIDIINAVIKLYYLDASRGWILI